MLCVTKSDCFVVLTCYVQLNAFRGDAEKLFNLLKLRISEAREHPIGELHIGMRLFAYTNAQAGEVIKAHKADYTAKALLTAVGAVCAKSHSADVEIDIIGHHKNMIGGDLIELSRLADSLTGEVHIRLRKHQKRTLTRDLALCRQSLKTRAVANDFLFAREDVHRHKSRIVTGGDVIATRISESDDEPLDRRLDLDRAFL